jgi:hypothetical protein
MMAASTPSSSKASASSGKVFASSGRVSASSGKVSTSSSRANSTPSSGKVKDPDQTTPHFFALPAELQVWIVEYLVSSNDKRNMSLVCKHMQALMMPCIYRHMTLHPLQLNELLRSIFSKKHPGLPYIQTLRISGNTYGAETPNLMPVLCRLLKSIPKDTLRVFE